MSMAKPVNFSPTVEISENVRIPQVDELRSRVDELEESHRGFMEAATNDISRIRQAGLDLCYGLTQEAKARGAVSDRLENLSIRALILKMIPEPLRDRLASWW